MCRSDYSLTWTCPSCDVRGRVASSHSELAWTDGGHEIDHRLDLGGPHLGPPLVLRCSACAELHWVSQDSLSYRSVPAKAATAALTATEDDYLEALERRLYSTRDEKLLLRLRIWRAGNDPAREEGARAQIRSLAAQANLQALYELLCDEDDAEAGTKAEVARQLGDYDECLRLVSRLPRLTQAREPLLTTARLARESSDRVGLIENLWTPIHLFTCPHCNRPGQIDWGSDLEVPIGDWNDSTSHAVACGSCKGWVWRGEHARTEETRLERLDGASAGLGCCLFFPLGVALSAVSAPAAATALGVFVGLLLLESLIGALRPWFVPNSLPVTERELLQRIVAQDWTGPTEERWLRAAAWHLRRNRLDGNSGGPEARGKWVLRDWVWEVDEGAQRNEAVLLDSLGEEPRDLLLRAEIHRRAGEDAAAREALARIPEHDESSRYCAGLVENRLRKSPRDEA
jgi:hypothetical protein